MPISARPAEAADRAFPGHRAGRDHGGVQPERLRDRGGAPEPVPLLGDPPDGQDAQAVYECLIELTADLPDALRRSLTSDRGRDMALWAELAADADIEGYFCDPHSP